MASPGSETSAWTLTLKSTACARAAGAAASGRRIPTSFANLMHVSGASSAPLQARLLSATVRATAPARARMLQSRPRIEHERSAEDGLVRGNPARLELRVEPRHRTGRDEGAVVP